MRALVSVIARPALIGIAVAASACTAGKIVNADGSNHPNTPLSSVSFYSPDTNNKYEVATTTSAPGQQGILTFSFDPAGPSSDTNDTQQIPEGNYKIEFLEFFPNIGVGLWESQVFHHEYDGNCTDAYINRSITCSLYKLVLCNGSGPCPAFSRDGVLTTVPLTLTGVY
jgi:hypothetical protein